MLYNRKASARPSNHLPTSVPQRSVTTQKPTPPPPYVLPVRLYPRATAGGYLHQFLHEVFNEIGVRYYEGFVNGGPV